MKKYQVNVHYDAVITVTDIIANSEEEALAIARERASQQSLNDAEVVDDKACVTGTDEIPTKNIRDKKRIPSAAELDVKQLELLDEFIASAKRLNEAGVSLVWNEDDNCICAANCDRMLDNSFFSEDSGEDIPVNAEYLSCNITAGLDIEITPISRLSDCYYIPNTDL